MSTPSDEPAGRATVSHPEAKPEGVRVDPWNFMFDVHHNPCFRHSLLWGGGMGATLALHSAIRHRSPMKAANAFMLTFTFISGASWLVCRSSQREEQKQMKHLVDLTLAKQANTKKEGATPAAPETGNK